MVLLALVLATGVMAVRAEAIAEITSSAIPPWSGAETDVWGQWVAPAGAIGDATTVTLYYTDGGLTDVESVYVWILLPDAEWSEDGVVYLSSRSPGRIDFNIDAIDGGIAVIVGIWGPGYGDNHPYVDYINRIAFYAPEATEAPAAPAAPADTAAPVSATVNPQTGDDFSTFGLIASGIALTASLLALVFVFNKKK